MKTQTILILAAIGLLGYYFMNKDKEEARPPDIAPTPAAVKKPFVNVLQKPITNAVKIKETSKR
jgi:hypothetical protein